MIRSVNSKSRQQLQETSGAVVSVKEDAGQCGICGGQMNVQKTTIHHGKTICHGQFEIRETIYVCAQRCRNDSEKLVTKRSTTLSEHIIPGRTFGYDVMAFVGIQRFIHHRQREEIRAQLLHEHRITLSAGTISNLSKLFLSYMQRLHNRHIDQLCDALIADGGWPLHIDATGEDGRGTLFVALAGWRQWVLGSWKISTERTDTILPCLQDVVRQFGLPCAIVRDLGRAMISAANTLLTEMDLNIPVLACHLHFLKDIGKDLLNPAHGELRALFRRIRIRPKLRTLIRDIGRKIGEEIEEARREVKAWQEQTSTDHIIPEGRAGAATVRALAQWIVDYHADSTNHDFPFDRPYLDLYDRCMTVRRAAEAFLRKEPEDTEVLKLLNRLHCILGPIVSEVPFKQITQRLRSRSSLFDELRDALRIGKKSSASHSASPSKNKPTLDQAEEEINGIRMQVDQFVESLKTRRPQRGPAQDTRKAIDIVLRHIEDHGEYLWGHVISLPGAVKGGTRLVDRTNNILEGFFHKMKHDERRRSGRKNLTQDFEHLPPEAALVYNLNHSDYVEITCGTLDRLHEAFVKLDIEQRKNVLTNDQRPSCAPDKIIPFTETASLPTDDRKLIRSEQMQRRIVSAAMSRAPRL